MKKRNLLFLVYSNTLAWMKKMGIALSDGVSKLDESEFINIITYKKAVTVSGTRKNGTSVQCIVVDKSVTKKLDVQSVMSGVNVDSANNEIIVITDKLLKSINDICIFARNIKHDWMLIDPTTHATSGRFEVITPENPEYNSLCDDVEKLPKMLYDLDPSVFWIGANIGDIVRIYMGTERTLNMPEIRYVTDNPLQ